MKTILIGDIHGRDVWKQIVSYEQDADRIVFVGDYFDSFDIPGVIQLQNFLDILEFKHSSKKEVVLLFGNHDFHYMSGFTDTNRYSGYQAGLAYQFRDVISKNLNDFKIAYLFEDILCSHAGIGLPWVEKHFGVEKDKSSFNIDVSTLSGIQKLVDLINEYFYYKPSIFNFDGWNPYGDNTTQTPIWIRPTSLIKANQTWKLRHLVKQVVGHTRVKDIFSMVEAVAKNAGSRYYMIDVFDNTKGYLIHENNTIQPKEII